MIRVTVEQLGDAYGRAAMDLFRRHGHMTPRSLGALFREEYGLHHKHIRHTFRMDENWIEFPNDRDYTMFLLKWA